MDKIVLELTADGTDGSLSSKIDINCTSRARVASYMVVIMKELAKIDDAALAMAADIYFDDIKEG